MLLSRWHLPAPRADAWARSRTALAFSNSSTLPYSLRDHQLQAAAAERVVRELLVGQLLGARKQLGRGQRLAVGLADQEAHQVARRAGEGQIAQRVVALELRLPCLLLGASRLRQGADHAGEDRRQRQDAPPRPCRGGGARSAPVR